MGLYSSFYASLSGLTANAGALSVIGNNLANLNTVGFKGSSSAFQDLFNATLGGVGTSGNGNPIQVGLGSRLGAIQQNFVQGSFQATSNVTDMAISGNGFFVVQNTQGGRAYTRAGNFTINKFGQMVDPNGSQIMGWNRAGNSVTTTGATSPIQINMGVTSPPAATQSFTATTNLNSSATPGTTYSMPIQIYDSLGAAHSLIYTYTKTPNLGEWSLRLTTDGGASVNVNGTGSDTMLVQFNQQGVLTNPAAPVPPANTNPQLVISGWTNGAAPTNTAWNLWQNGSSTLTGYSAPSTTSNTSQDGFGAGTIRSLVVDQNGLIVGNFTNGQTMALAQVALATFANVNGLSKQGDNTWVETLASGSGNIGVASEGGRGAVLGANLELGNVDVAEEFTKLIISQRGYQANGRVVTTSDELMQETLNLKR